MLDNTKILLNIFLTMFFAGFLFCSSLLFILLAINETNKSQKNMMITNSFLYIGLFTFNCFYIIKKNLYPIHQLFVSSNIKLIVDINGINHNIDGNVIIDKITLNEFNNNQYWSKFINAIITIFITLLTCFIFLEKNFNNLYFKVFTLLSSICLIFGIGFIITIIDNLRNIIKEQINVTNQEITNLKV